MRYPNWLLCSQESVAPFALENLGCAGNEARLLDCPVADDVYSEDILFYTSKFRDYFSRDAFDNSVGNIAKVACGTIDISNSGVVPQFFCTLSLSHV